MDYYWVNENIQRKPLRYSDFNIGDTIRHTSDTEKERQDWLGTPKERLNKYIANDCDGIIACLYEYWACYAPLFPTKTSFAPLPIKPHETLLPKRRETGDPINIFVGISKSRNEYKGTDIMLAAAQAVSSKYPGRINLNVAEGVPFSQYVETVSYTHLRPSASGARGWGTRRALGQKRHARGRGSKVAAQRRIHHRRHR